MDTFMLCRSRNGPTVPQSIYTAFSFAGYVLAAAMITRTTSRIDVDGRGRKSFTAALFTFVLLCEIPRLALQPVLCAACYRLSFLYSETV